MMFRLTTLISVILLILSVSADSFGVQFEKSDNSDTKWNEFCASIADNPDAEIAFGKSDFMMYLEACAATNGLDPRKAFIDAARMNDYGTMSLIWGAAGPFDKMSCTTAALAASQLGFGDPAYFCFEKDMLSYHMIQQLFFQACQYKIPRIMGIVLRSDGLTRDDLDYGLELASSHGHEKIISYVMQMKPYPTDDGILAAYNSSGTILAKQAIVKTMALLVNDELWSQKLSMKIARIYREDRQKYLNKSHYKMKKVLLNSYRRHDTRLKSIKNRYGVLDTVPESKEMQFIGLDNKLMETREKEEKLYTAVETGIVMNVWKAIKAGARPDSRGNKAVELACYYGHDNIAKELYRIGASSNLCMTYSVLNGDTQMITYLGSTSSGEIPRSVKSKLPPGQLLFYTKSLRYHMNSIPIKI